MKSDPNQYIDPLSNTTKNQNFSRPLIQKPIPIIKIDKASLLVFFVFACLCLGGIIKDINKMTGIPYTPMLFLIGLFLGFSKENLGHIFNNCISNISQIDPNAILMIFLPVLIFESGFNSDWHIFKRQFGQIFLLAFPCVFVSAFLIAFSLKVFINYDDSYYTWTGAFLFGSILSCTDTVAVLALLKEFGVPKKFQSLIEGESLLNDGTCMVLFTIASALMKGQSGSFMDIVKLFFSLTFGGIVYGLIFGIISAFWIKRIFNDQILVVNVTFVGCYILYFIAVNIPLGIEISGIIALVSFALYMSVFGKVKINNEADHAVSAFWKYISFCAETTIFLLAGIIVGANILRSGAGYINEEDHYKLFALYIFMILSRFCAISVFMPWLSKWGYGLTWKEVIVLSYGGLRGAIGIAFTLIIAHDTQLPKKFRQIILFDMAGSALLTLIVNAPTTGILIQKLRMQVYSNAKNRFFTHFLEKIIEEIDKKIEDIKENRFLNVVDWDKVKSYNNVREYQQKISHINEKEIIIQNDEQNNQDILMKSEIEMSLLDNMEQIEDNMQMFTDEEVDQELLQEGRNKFLMALKGEYWDLFELNQTSGEALILLIESAKWDLDNEANSMCSWEFISSGLMNHQFIKILFQSRFFPIIGKFSRNKLFNHVCFAYDVVITYVEAHEKVEEMFKLYQLDDRVINDIIRESEDNRQAAEKYLYNYLNVSFPEITKQIQTKKATGSILEHQKQILLENLRIGQIDEKEYKFFKKQIDYSIQNINNYSPDWHVPHIREFLKDIPLFQHIDEATLNLLIKQSKDQVIQSDQKLIKEHNKSKGFFILTRGCGTESSDCGQVISQYREKKGVGSVISYHHLISQSFRYQSTFVTDCMCYAQMFDLDTMQKIINKSMILKEIAYRESMLFFSKYYYEQLRPLGNLDRDTLIHLIKGCQFQRYANQQIIDATKGGIFLKGIALEKIEDLKSQFIEQIQEHQVHEELSPKHHQINQNQQMHQQSPQYLNISRKKGTLTKQDTKDMAKTIQIDPIYFKGMAFIMPKNYQYRLVAEKTCYMLHFVNVEEVFEMIDNLKVIEKDKQFKDSICIYRKSRISVRCGAGKLMKIMN